MTKQEIQMYKRRVFNGRFFLLVWGKNLGGKNGNTEKKENGI